MKDYKRLTEKTKLGTYIIGDDSPIIQRLGELEDKIEQGLLVELPKKVYEIGYCYGWEINEKEIGEDVFLTKEEAEASLQELRGGE